MKYTQIALLALYALVAIPAARGQSSSTTGTLRGQVVDPSGAVVPNAAVVVLESSGTTHSANTSHSGGYEIGNLPPGKYTVTANAQGFSVFVQDGVNVPSGQVTQFNISLEISVEQQKVNVEGVSPQVDVNPANNASAIIMTGKDLDALPDDPDELQSDLEALAGPSAGPSGGQLYIDGFTGGQLPPKSSIREIRINQNPFSAEYDKLGYGRIEVFTKPGTDKFHGQFAVIGNNSGLNTRNPFLGQAEQTPYYSVIYMGNIGGPINKNASFFFDIQHRNIDEIAVVNAFIPPIMDVNGVEVGTPYSASVPNPRTRTNLSPRIDYQLTPSNTLTLRYQYYHDGQQNAGVGGLDLNAVNTPDFTSPSSGYNTSSSENTLQLTDTQTLGAKAVNETRFEYERDTSQQFPLSSAPSLSVQGNFVGGGSSSGTQSDNTDHYEVQNYTSLSLGKHFVKFGVRVRAVHDINASNAGFNGQFTFPDIATFVGAEQGVAGNYPNQFTLGATASGASAIVPVTMVDAGLYVQDDFKFRPNLTLSYGLRFETQTDIRDHDDWGPRVGFSWGVDGRGKNAPKTVVRGGFGIFYDRFGQNLILNADRYNGVNQQLFTISCTTNCSPITFYPNIPAPSSLPTTAESKYSISPALRTPYTMQTAFSLERQLTKNANFTVSYLHSRGVHQLVSVNSNARLPGTPYSDGAFPDPSFGPIYQYVSEGIYKQNQLIAHFTVRAGARLSLFGFYALGYANSDTGASSGGSTVPNLAMGTTSPTPNFPSDQYDISADYGRASFDIRNRVFAAGSISLPHNVRVSPFMIFNTGAPYNVTVGQDLSGSTLLNVRPAFQTASSPACTFPNPAACRYTVPTTVYTQIPVNYLSGPNQFTLNLRLAKTFAFGPESSGNTGQGNGNRGGGGGHGGGGGYGRGPGGPGGIFAAPTTNHRYNLTFSVIGRNILNIVNPATPIGTITSQFFGKSNALAGGPFSSAAANRKIELQAMFSF